MSERDGVKDLDYDELRKTALTREQCFAILACIRTPLEQHDQDLLEENKKMSGVRVPGVPEPDHLESLEVIRELREMVDELRERVEASEADDSGG